MNIKEKINDWAASSLWIVPSNRVKHAEFSLCNGACHYNSVAAARSGRADAVWLVWAGGRNGVVHFINSKKGVFFDETWHDYDRQEYRVIRKVKPCEYDEVYEILVSAKRDLIRKHGSVLQKLRLYCGRVHGII